jgi:hypothetical protein
MDRQSDRGMAGETVTRRDRLLVWILARLQRIVDRL